jgi:large subunit ribosomal protein L17
MRHGKTVNHLGRTTSHRKAMLSNMACSLIVNKRISTTLAKAKALRKFVEPILTKSKTDSTNNRRVTFSYLKDKESVKELFGNVAEKIANRPGGYTRILKTGNREGDNAEMCIIELVDYNENMLGTAKVEKVKTRRGRTKKVADSVETPSAEVVEETPKKAKKAKKSEDSAENSDNQE